MLTLVIIVTYSNFSVFSCLDLQENVTLQSAMCSMYRRGFLRQTYNINFEFNLNEFGLLNTHTWSYILVCIFNYFTERQHSFNFIT